MNQRAHRRRAFHGVRQPGVQRELAALAGRAGEQAEAQPKQRAAGYYSGASGGDGNGRLPNVGYVEGVEALGGKIVGLEEKIDDCQQKADVADACNDECFLCRRRRRWAVVPETDEQIRRQPHQLPEDVHLHYVGGQHQPDHRGAEQGHIGVVPGETFVAVHVTQGINLNHQADARHHYQHHVGQRVQQQAHLYGRARSEAQPQVRSEVIGGRAGRRPQQPQRQHKAQAQRGNSYVAGQLGKAAAQGPYHQPYQQEGRNRRQENRPYQGFGQHLALILTASERFLRLRARVLWARRCGTVRARSSRECHPPAEYDWAGPRPPGLLSRFPQPSGWARV